MPCARQRYAWSLELVLVDVLRHCVDAPGKLVVPAAAVDATVGADVVASVAVSAVGQDDVLRPLAVKSVLQHGDVEKYHPWNSQRMILV